MAIPRKTPVQLSGGAGFDFEDAIGARLLLSMLRGEAVFGREYGISSQLDFQVGESGWWLDDLLLTSIGEAGEFHRAAISVKTPKQITATGGFNASFKNAVWAQWRSAATGPFHQERDLLCLATPNVADTVLKAWHELQDEALGTARERFLERAKTATGTKRAIFSSLIPDSGDYPDVDELEVVALFRQIRLLKFDLNNASSLDAASAVTHCRELMADELERGAEDLWVTLKTIAKEHRAIGGTVDIKKLNKLLAGLGFRLARHPIFSNDWNKLDRITADARGLIRGHIGDGAELPRAIARKKLCQLMALSNSVVLLGPSGVGKSALLTRALSESDGRAIWLNAGHFRYANATEQRTSLALEHDLSQILASSTATKNTLVIDAAEAFSESELQLLAQALREAGTVSAAEWTLVFSCQTHAWEGVRGLLNSIGSLQPEPYEIGAVDDADVDHVLDLCGITQFRNETSAKRLFGNLKILDWVVSALTARPFEAASEKTSIETVLNIVWQFWVGQGAQRHLIAKLLDYLGVEQAATFGKGASFNALDYSALEVLPELESRDVLRTANETVYFSHDLIGDWVRFRALCRLDDTLTELRNRADNPLWHTAIRLYGQSLLERNDDTQLTWEAAQRDVRDETAQGDIAGDLLLDSVYSHPNAYAVLTRYRGLFLVESTGLFHRIAKRFLLGATVADPRAAAMTTEDDMRLLLEASMRIPLWLRWPSMLKFLDDNVAAVSRCIPQSVAKVCALWLQHTPIPATDDKPYPFRKEAARVALALAREAQALNEEGVWFQGKDKTFYEAALLGSPDLPDDVGQFALEMAYRRPLDKGQQQRLAAHEAKQRLEALERARKAPRKKRAPVPIMPSMFRGDRLDPWPNGPTESVREEFREAAWSGNNLKGLIAARPTIAAEVILALCIEEPGYEYERESPLGKPGLAYWRSTMPDSYFNGPFLAFLRRNSTVAIDLIVELVNFATARWVDQSLKRHPEGTAPHISLALNGEEVRWHGDWQVYGWFRGSGSGCPVSSSLMALEQWLYLELASENNVSRSLETILSRSRSAAIAGVLCTVGKKYSTLFEGPLRPLLGAANVYEWDRILVHNSQAFTMGAFLWAQHGEVMFETLQAWHGLEHRHFDLRDIAQDLLLTNSEMPAFFADRIAIWDGHGRIQEFLRAQLDIGNYTRIETDAGEIRWKFKYPDTLELKAAESQRDSQYALWVMNLPYTCQQLIEGDVGFPEAQVGPLAEALMTLANSDPNPDSFVEQKKPDAVLAGYCVLQRHHREWLRANADFNKWARLYLEELLRHPPGADDFDSPVAINPTGWDVWAGRLSVLLLAENVEDMRWREALACSLMGPHYATTGEVLRAAFERREQLGEDFIRLVNLAKLWSAVELVWAREPNKRSLSRRAQLIRAFASRSLTATPLSVQRLAAAGQRFQIRQRIREYRPFGDEDITAAADRLRQQRVAGLNSMLVIQTMSWLPISMTEGDDDLIALVEHEFSDLSNYCLSMAPSDPEEKTNDDVPNELVNWWLAQVAAISMILMPEKARERWQPIMELGIAAHYWVDTFVSGFFLNGAKEASSPEHFRQRWQPLVEYVLTSPVWQKQGYRDYRRGRTMSDVMGLRAGASCIGDVAYTGVITSMKGHYQRWSALWLHDKESANAFAAFLTRPSVAGIILDGIVWLSTAAAKYDQYDWRENGLASNLALALQRAWNEHRTDVVIQGSYRDAFLALLSLLVQRQEEVAVVLQRNVGGTGAH